MTLESEVCVEVPFAIPTMQVVQGSWMGLVTRSAVGVGVFDFGTRFGEPASMGSVQLCNTNLV